MPAEDCDGGWHLAAMATFAFQKDAARQRETLLEESSHHFSRPSKCQVHNSLEVSDYKDWRHEGKSKAQQQHILNS